MDLPSLQERISSRGRDFFARIRGEKPSIFNRNWWTGKVLDWAMRNDDFKARLFRFIDVLPSLTTTESLSRHIKEYFVGPDEALPPVLKWGTKALDSGGKMTAALLANSLKANFEAMAHQFIIGRNMAEALTAIDRLRRDNFAFTVDILGEATVSIEEEERYQQGYLDLLAELDTRQQDWPPLGAAGRDLLDWGSAPKINLAVKPTTLYSQTDPADFAGSVAAITERFVPILNKARHIGAFVCIDMEQFRYKDITLEVYRRLRSAPEFLAEPNLLGVALQSYLLATDHDLEELLHWAGREQLPIAIRLVKGAYWDYEQVVAQQNSWPIPVHTSKAATDAAFERQAGVILQNHDICHLACGTHNIRSLAAVMEMAAEFKVPTDRYEFQVLFGMAEPIRKGLQTSVERVRLYCPFGDLLPGMAYLVRRLLENTANESFLRHTFAEEKEIDRLLQDPAVLAARQPGIAGADSDRQPGRLFVNEAQADFTRSATRAAFVNAIAEVRTMLGRTYPLRINGNEIMTDDVLASVNPARPDEIVGLVCQAGREEVEQAMAAARQAAPVWRALPVEKRAAYLFRAADRMRQQIYRLAAWQVLEVGKQWGQAYGDVTEALDFLEYYGREMLRLGQVQQLGGLPGEENHYFYQPRGTALVIAPWNFPMAISCGMCAAALVTGNCVLYKPSGLSGVNGALLADIFLDLGLPAGVFTFLPARGGKMGDFLVDHPGVAMIAFTGSMEVGLRIAARAAVVQPGQRQVKKVIAEMGGKNAIIVDDDADLDEAVPHIIRSAFGYQGQKCSACSRVIVLASIYEPFVHRLVAAAKSIRIGPAEDPANLMGPVIDRAAQEKILHYIATGSREGTLLLSRPVSGDDGFYVPLTIFGDIVPSHRVAREEIFGPVLAIMRAVDFDEALALADSTPFALTGGVFSRSPDHLQAARDRFRVGNLYLNRGITGALVGRQPFGGFGMSGIGSKAGGPDYLPQFMEPRTITENTMRRGFAPCAEK
jgi:RHH-type proline utilization regulon transcriptional repressor/proline dehydrogenase/delta 1-pyrroline-5-carboxylate dehydrogenase